MDDEQQATSGETKDPAEQEALARDLGEELADAFVRHVRGELDFADLVFLTFETLQDLHVVAGGDYEVEYEDQDGDPTEQYDEDVATDQQEELAQEPSRP